MSIAIKGRGLIGVMAEILNLERHKRVFDLPADLLQVEPSLMATKWFDYRFMHPEEATQLFAKEYVSAYQALWARYQDYRESDSKRPINEGDVLKNGAQRTTLWKARQAVDWLGIPYSFFCGRAIKLWVERGSQTFPLPNQLYGDEKLLAAVSEQWEEFAGGRLHYGMDERYLAQSWTGHPAQLDHAQWLIGQAFLRNHPTFTLRLAIFDRPMIPDVVARELLGEKAHLVDRAQTENAYPQDITPLRDLDVRYGCFGLPRGYQATEPSCQRCPHADECQVLCQEVTEHCVEAHGSADPQLEHKRELARKRKAAQRARERATNIQ